MRYPKIRLVPCLGSLLLLGGFAQAQTGSLSACKGYQCYDHPPACGDTFWMGVLDGSGIKSAEDLLLNTPFAIRVTKRYPITGGCDGYDWDGTTCTPGPLGCTAVPEPGAAGCGSACFCVGSGEGAEVTVTQPVRFNLWGWDSAFTHQVQAFKTYLVTLPINTPMILASDLLAALPGGTGFVTGLFCGTQQVYTGAVPGTNFLLTPGQAYQVMPAFSGTLTLATQGGPPVPCLGNGYEVTGTASGSSYAWGVDADASTTCCDLRNDMAPGVTFGFPAADLVRSVVDEINSTGGCLDSGLPCSDDSDCLSGVCLTAGHEILAQVDTSVGTAEFCVVSRLSAPELYLDSAPGPATCNVNTSGPCSFNPNAELASIPSPYATMRDADRSEWTPVSRDYDIVTGDLGDLRASAGDFSANPIDCLDDDRNKTFLDVPGNPSSGRGYFYLVRASNAFRTTGYNFLRLPGQIGDRDGEITSSGADCPP